MIAIEKTWLVIPYDQLSAAKRAAGKLPKGEDPLAFDNAQKLWFAKPGADLSILNQWLPDPQAQLSAETDPREEFAEVLASAGFELDGLPDMDGQRHRVRTQGDKSGEKTGVYVGYLDGIPAGWYQDHRTHTEPQKWKTRGQTQDHQAQKQVRALALQKKQSRATAQARQYQHHAHRVSQLIAALPEASHQHPYLLRKGVTATTGVKQDKRGRLVIPLRNAAGEIRTVQRIGGNGFKSLKKGAQKAGSFFVVGGELQAGQPLLYAEGYATAASIHAATALPVVMAVDAGNLPPVAAALATRYPDHQHVFLADDDRKNSANKGLKKAQEAADLTQGRVIAPVFTAEESQKNLTDFNDLQQARGVEAVREQLAAPLAGLTLNSAALLTAKAAPGGQANNTASPAEREAPHPKEMTSDDPSTVATACDNGIYPEAVVNEKNAVPPPTKPVDLDGVLQNITHQYEGNTVVYAHRGERAFIDHGNRITMASPAASQNDTLVLAALLVAKQHYYGKVELTGSEAFKHRAINLIAQYNLPLVLKNPQQQMRLDEARQKPEQREKVPPAAPDDAIVALDSPTAQKVSRPTVTPPSALQAENPTEKLTGKLLEHRASPYQFNQAERMSYFVKMRTVDGEKVIWGKELSQAVADSGLKIGDMITLRSVGQHPVTLNVPVKDEQGTLLRWEKREGHRNQWEIKSAIDPRLLVRDQQQAFPPASLRAYDWATFQQIQQALLRQNGIRLSLPSSESPLLWLQPDGKGITKAGNPETVALPPPNQDAGTPVMRACLPDGQISLQLVQGNGDYLQGIVRYQGEYQHVLGQLCTRENGTRYLALNVVEAQGLRLIGHGNAVNQVPGAAVAYDTFVFHLQGEKDKRVVKLDQPEKMPPAWHKTWGFTQGYTPVTPMPAPDARVMAENTPKMRPNHAPCPGM